MKQKKFDGLTKAGMSKEYAELTGENHALKHEASATSYERKVHLNKIDTLKKENSSLTAKLAKESDAPKEDNKLLLNKIASLEGKNKLLLEQKAAALKEKKLLLDKVVKALKEKELLLDKAVNLEEENKLLIEQTIQDEKVLIEAVKPEKKPSDMGEFELAAYMTRKTSTKTF